MRAFSSDNQDDKKSGFFDFIQAVKKTDEEVTATQAEAAPSIDDI